MLVNGPVGETVDDCHCVALLPVTEEVIALPVQPEEGPLAVPPDGGELQSAQVTPSVNGPLLDPKPETIM